MAEFMAWTDTLGYYDAIEISLWGMAIYYFKCWADNKFIKK